MSGIFKIGISVSGIVFCPKAEMMLNKKNLIPPFRGRGLKKTALTADVGVPSTLNALGFNFNPWQHLFVNQAVLPN